MNEAPFRGPALLTPFRRPLTQVSSVTVRSFSGHRLRTETPCKVENAADTSPPPPPCERTRFRSPGARIPPLPARSAPPPAAPASGGRNRRTRRRCAAGSQPAGNRRCFVWGHPGRPSARAAPRGPRAARHKPCAVPSGARRRQLTFSARALKLECSRSIALGVSCENGEWCPPRATS